MLSYYKDSSTQNKKKKKNQSEINTHANMPEGSAQTVEISKSHSIFMLLTAVVFSCNEESGA